ncbi:N-acetylmuramoyl-L-alanine amidase LytC precursor [Ruminiclostridium hungatei]|uniref:N-acetylmuramoyl-L-alanine amidase LytC n=1 Tax=Ruminiclostridium hungatei TaxID=48256 RepID=A0A1V4SH09_RUMHU|nr:N-acetylmuramoyl-L-alanine amidase [Ruminiclostridium hungatei]OPX43084.1 N-acetylmuramoyl-L-alanine amidase LytC precursor [Ruminiclostridium hungatei]
MKKKSGLYKFITGMILFCVFMIVQNTVFAAQSLTLNYDGKTVKYSDAAYKININGKEIKTDLPGIVLNKTVMFPLRAVFEGLGGTVVWNAKTQIMDITYKGVKYQFLNNSSNAKINGKAIKMSAPAKKINERLIVPVDFMKNIKGLAASADAKANIISISTDYVGSVKEISSTNVGEKTVVTLTMDNHKGYVYSRLTNPDRIVVDFKNIKAAPREIQAVSSRISGISVSAVTEASVRITINLNEMANFTVSDIQDGCKITIEKPVNVNLSYENSFDRVYFSLKGIKLAEIKEANNKSYIAEKYKHEYDKENLKYTITIASQAAVSLKDDIYHINDDRVSTVEICRDKETQDTKIIINAKQDFVYLTSYNDKRMQSEINLLTPAKEDEMLVVIDAGHGGQDPGANNGKILEKDINLDIALKLEAQLKKNNVKTFMLRQDDTFVGLYDRPYIANALNATLFVSIHNNAIDSAKVSGTETLYYPEAKGDTKFTGEKFAKLVQDSLMNKLKSVNRKTVERPGLVVLKYTKMPAVLAEVGFVTNAAEVKKLIDPAYQQMTAEALNDAILKALDTIKSEKKVVDKLEDEKTPEPDTNTEVPEGDAEQQPE